MKNMALDERVEAVEPIALQPYRTTGFAGEDTPGDASNDSLLEQDTQGVDHDKGMTGRQAWNLYTTHFLSTWNARTYEFAAVSQISWCHRPLAGHVLTLDNRYFSLQAPIPILCLPRHYGRNLSLRHSLMGHHRLQLSYPGAQSKRGLV